MYGSFVHIELRIKMEIEVQVKLIFNYSDSFNLTRRNQDIADIETTIDLGFGVN